MSSLPPSAKPTPPPLPPRPPRHVPDIPGDIDPPSATDDALDLQDFAVAPALDDELPPIDEGLSDAELRQMYEDEEVERFLKLFSSHVTEVYLPQPKDRTFPRTPKRKVTLVGEDLSEMLNAPQSDGISSAPPADHAELNMDSSTGWVLVGAGNFDSSQGSVSPLSDPARWFAQILASRLPEPKPAPSSPFSLTRLRVAFQRLYMAGYPTYIPLLTTLYHLATWRSPTRSLFFCSLYFFLWAYDSLPLAFVSWLLFTLVHRRYVNYPTANDLRKRRRRMEETEVLGETMDRFSTSWISAAPTLVGQEFSLSDTWQTFRTISKARRAQARAMAAETVAGISGKGVDDAPSGLVKEALKEAKRERKRQEVEEDWRNAIVELLEGLADVHERIRNVFLWRDAEVSWFYSVALFGIFVVVLVVPQYLLIKLILLGLGAAFWFIPPIIKAMTPEERARLPLLFGNAPTDVDYATSIIADRTSRGLPVLPRDKKRRRDKGGVSRPNSPAPPLSPSASMLDLSDAASIRSAVTEKAQFLKPPEFIASRMSPKIGSGEDGEREGKRELFEKMLIRGVSWTNKAAANQTNDEDATSYLCQYGTSPGILTLSATQVRFVPAGRSDGVDVYELSSIRGVKKLGLWNGLVLKYEAGGKEREVKFHWVTKRDEIFARLVGFGHGSKKS